MAERSDKIRNALDEGRILVLGTQVLLGFQLRGVFEPVFERLPASDQYLKVAGLGLLVVTLALLILPAAFHRIVEAGQDTERLHRHIGGVVTLALLPFAAALAIDVLVAVDHAAGRAMASLAAAAASLVALGCWYVLPMLARARGPRAGGDSMDRHPAATPLKDRIRHVLTEARVVLPGAQALLGFQLAAVLTESFERLPIGSKMVHLASLGLIALTTVLLMTPAAWHRIVERGEETERFHRLASRLVLAATVPLALGLAGDVFVIVRKVFGSDAGAIAAGAAAAALCYGLWFGFTYAARATSRRPRRRNAAA